MARKARTAAVRLILAATGQNKLRYWPETRVISQSAESETRKPKGWIVPGT